jgi:ankyrin repeat protein
MSFSKPSYQGKSYTSYTSKNNIPNKFINNELILKLFNTVATGNFLKIQNFLRENSMYMTSKNIEPPYESVLHIIIKNSNITLQEKEQLVELAIDNGAGVNIPDQNNIYPIHLASQKQLKNIISILLKKGANINCLDNLGKNALHYSTSGDSQECIADYKKKQKPLIPDKKDYYIEPELNNKIKNLQSKIKDFFKNDEATRMYITQIENCFLHINEMFPYELDDKKNILKNEIQKIRTDKTIIDKKNEIRKKKYNFKLQIFEFIKEKIGEGMIPLNIETGISSGWGPDDFPTNRILNARDINEYLIEINKSVHDDYFTIDKNIKQVMNNLYVAINKLPIIDAEYNQIIGYYFIKDVDNDIILNDTNIKLPYLDYDMKIDVNVVNVINTNNKNLIFNEKNNITKEINYVGYFLNNIHKICFDAKYRTYYQILIILYNELDELIKIILSNSIDNNFYNLYKNISKCISKLLEISLCCILIDEDKVNLIIQFNNFIKKNQIMQEDIDFFNALIIQFESMPKILSDIYTSVSELVLNLNKILGFIDKKSSRELLIKYFFGDDSNANFDDFYLAKKTGKVLNIFDINIKKLKEFPTTLNDLQKIKGDSFLNTKKLLIMEFIPQITQTNNPIFYKNKLNPNAAEFKPQITQTNNPIFYKNKLNPNAAEFKPQNNSASESKNSDQDPYQNSIEMVGGGQIGFINFSDDIDYDIKNTYNDITPNTTGEISLEQSRDFDKNEILPYVIGTYLNFFIKIIKYSIVRSTIKYFYNNEQAIFSEVSNEIKEHMKFDDKDKSFVLLLIGKYVDNILIDYMKSLISQQSNKIINNFIDKIIIDKTLDNNNILPEINENVKITNINKIYEDVIKKYENLLVSKSDINSNENKINKMINMNYSINSLEEICYKIDLDVVKLLIKSGININQKDNLGNTPIYNAIILQNDALVELLINKKAIVWNKNYMNFMGKNAFQYTLNNYLNFLKVLMINKYDVCEKLTNNIVEKFHNNSQDSYGNNIPPNSKFLLPMCLYLLNYEIFLYTKNKIDKTENIILSEFVNNKNNKLNFNSNLQTYIDNLKNFKFNDKKDFTQIIDIINNHQYKILTKNNIPDINNLSKIQKIYNDIYIFSNIFFENSKEYNSDNLILTKVLNIIIHIIKKVVCVDIYNTILKGLFKYLVNIYPYHEKLYNKDKYNEQISDKVKNIVNDNNNILINYIINIIPIKCVKSILQIFEHEDDPDNQITLDAIFENIDNILMSSTKIGINKDNNLIINLKKYVYPYYIDYLQLFVKEMFNLMSNYIRTLQYQTKMINILNLISKRAEEEFKFEQKNK